MLGCNAADKDRACTGICGVLRRGPLRRHPLHSSCLRQRRQECSSLTLARIQQRRRPTITIGFDQLELIRSDGTAAGGRSGRCFRVRVRCAIACIKNDCSGPPECPAGHSFWRVTSAAQEPRRRSGNKGKSRAVALEGHTDEADSTPGTAPSLTSDSTLPSKIYINHPSSRHRHPPRRKQTAAA